MIKEVSLKPSGFGQILRDLKILKVFIDSGLTTLPQQVGGEKERDI
jgi:hypothetical protein